MKRRAASLLFLCLAFPLGAAADDAIQAGYERLYSGDASGAYEHFRQLSEREPENLAAAFGVLQALEARGLGEPAAQEEFEQRAEQLMEKADDRADKNARDAEALFYLAQAYGARANYRFRYDKGIWGAARDAARSKGYSEDYLKLDPGRGDAYFTLGLYNYYVDIAPTFVKFLRALLFLPGGNRTAGLEQIERAARDGRLFAPAAKRMLVDIYGWFEGRPEDGERLARELASRYGDNPSHWLQLARLYASPALEDFDRAAAQYAAVLERAAQGHPHFQNDARYNALAGLARVRQQQWRIDEAIAALTFVIDAAPQRPKWVPPSFLLLRSNLRGLLNDPRAGDDARRVQAEPKWKDWRKAAEQRLKWLAERTKTGEAARYVELIPGNRLVAEGRFEEAAKFYEQVRRASPADWQVRYRQAYLEFARGNIVVAAAALEGIANSNPGKMPDWLKASVLLYLARCRDLNGERQQALKLYKRIANAYENETAAQSARLGLITPYRRPGKR